jgi:hypothetical protein
MAAKKKSKTPALRYLRYEMTMSGTPGTEVSAFIDLARDLSRVNRRLYRQGRDYHVKKITVVSSDTPNGGNRISFSTVHDTWVTRNAWRRGFETFKMMQAEATKQISGDVKGTWNDFKVFLSPDHRAGTKLDPLDNGGNAWDAGDWVYTKLVTPDGTTSADEFELTLIGDHSGAAGSRNSVGLIKSYGESRATVQNNDPNVPSAASDDPLVNVFDYGTAIDEVIDRMEVEGDEPPYDIADYPGGANNGQKPSVVQDTTIVDGKSVVGGFNAIAGLIEVEAKSTLPNDVISILVELAPGNYRGIAAEVI